MGLTVSDILTLVTGIIAALGLTSLIAASLVVIIAVAMLQQLISRGR